MNPFKKKTTPEPTGRRRPIDDPDRGSKTNSAFSYYAQRSYHADNTGRLDETQAIERDRPRSSSLMARHRPLFGVLMSLIAIGVLYSMVLATEPKITLVQDAATAYFLQDQSVYRQSVEQSLGSSLFNRNKLTVDTGSARLSLLKNYPEIKNASITIPLFGQQPQVSIEPYSPSFILTTAGSNAFLLDTTGRAMATTSQITNIDELKLPTLQDRSGLTVKLGSRALPSTTVSFAQTVVAALKAKQQEPATLTLPAASNELDVTVGGTSYFVKFNLQADPLQQAGAYLATRQRLEADHVVPGQYIDVRVPERAYYK